MLNLGFGMTELSVASHLGTRDTPDGSVGVLVPNTEMKVLFKTQKLSSASSSSNSYRFLKIHRLGIILKLGSERRRYFVRPERRGRMLDSRPSDYAWLLEKRKRDQGVNG